MGILGLGARKGILFAVAALGAGMLCLPPGASAISDEEALFKVGRLGSGAGEVDLPSGVATDPVTSHVVTGETGVGTTAERVSEFTPWGDFVKAFGWDVAPGAVNEQQEVRVRATAGQYRLSLGPESTGDLPFDAAASTVEAALDGLAAIGSGGVGVTEVPGNADGLSPFVYVIAFNGSTLAGTNVAQLTASDGTAELTGGVPSKELVVRTRAQGHPATTGLESCTTESGCKGGVVGAGAGQFNRPQYVAVAPGGEIFVRDVELNRVQKFDSSGQFLMMFGGGVDKTTGEDRCTKADLEAGEECQGGVNGSGAGEFSGEGGIALCSGGLQCPGGALFVADKGRIQKFNLEGEFQSQVMVNGGGGVSDIALNPVSGDFYAALAGKENIRRIDSVSGNEIGQPLVGRRPVATDLSGNLFTGSDDGRILEYDSNGQPLSPPSCCQAELLPPPNSGEKRFGLEGLGTNGVGTLYATYGSPSVDSFLRAFGPGPATYEGPPPVPPTISAQFASAVQSDEASVVAMINPHFWTDTKYFIQYGTGDCATGGCPNEVPVPPADLTSKISGSPVRSADVALKGLQPGTTYHYRFVAHSGGGGPVFGVDPDGSGSGSASAIEGLDSTFTTFDPLSAPPCPNDALRPGSSARLPDCRAYEMVSPVDKDGGDIKSLVDVVFFATALEKSAIDGSRFTYSSSRSFGDSEGAPYTNQYFATRSAKGWATGSINAPMHASFDQDSLENPYKAFSADLCHGWLMNLSKPALAPGAPQGYRNIYQRDLCGVDSYEPLVQVQPPVSSGLFTPVLMGTSADSSDAIFVVRAPLTANAVGNRLQVYHARNGHLQLVCVLPTGLNSGRNCSVGTGGEVEPEVGTVSSTFLERESSLTHALSADGSRAYWTDVESSTRASGPGTIYMRENPDAEESTVKDVKGNCVRQPEKACTIEVSGTVAKKASRFLGASADGSKALLLFTEAPVAGKLFKFEVENESTGKPGSKAIAGKVLGVAAASADLSRIYFISEEAVPGTTGATAGKPNLYLDEEGSKIFIATLNKDDIQLKLPSNTSPVSIYHVARATEDGRVLAFASTESIGDYDNVDLNTERRDSEVYIYEAGSSGPVCVSCNPGGARPAGRVVPELTVEKMAMAGSLALPTTQLYSQRVLSTDGRRLFFNSFDALLPQDTNGKQDVYEWESAGSRAECEQKGAQVYVAASTGCLSLISSGESPQDSQFLDASASGDDVFFVTNESLLGRDPGLYDVYDARVGGGIAEEAKAVECQGEGCQAPAIAPSEPTLPASSTFSGPEDKVSKKKHKKKHHHKNKRHHKKGKKKASHHGKGAGR